MVVGVRKIIRLAVLLSTLLGAAATQASNVSSLLDDDDGALEQQRKQYRATMKLLYKGQRKAFDAAAEQLRDYPLYPYLKYRELSRYIETVSKDELNDFAREFPDSPMSIWLRRNWISNLADQKDWDTYLQEYRLGQYNSKFDCQYYWAQYKVGDRNIAFEGARKMWLVGDSQDDACNPLFQVWKTTGEMEGQLAWERTAMAMANGKTQLASYLERLLPKDLQPLASEWRELYRNPQRLKHIARYTQWGDKARPMLVTGFSRLIRKDRELAQQLWPQYAQAFQFSTDERARVANEFAFVLAVRKQDNADYWLTQATQFGKDNQSEYDLIAIAIRHALYKQDWNRLRVWLSLLDKDQVQEESWQYWLSRAELKLGRLNSDQLPLIQPRDNTADALNPDNFLHALRDEKRFMELLPESLVTAKFTNYAPEGRLQKLSAKRDYYGFLASERLNRPLNLNMIPTQVREEDLQATLARPAVKRAREFHQLGDEQLARYEWGHLIRNSSEQERSVLAHLAYIWGWHNPAIRAAYDSDAYNNLDIRFPIAYEPVVSKYANSVGLDEDWVFSLIRQESAFLPQARSSVGAMGMMQIMPGTARRLSHQMGISTPSGNDMLTAETNVKLGTYYMSQLRKQFDGNIILATAAYNAGPHRADAWQPEYLPVSGDIWIETIPFSETRDYVKNILTYQAIYRHHLGKQVALSDALKLIPAKKMQATVMR